MVQTGKDDPVLRIRDVSFGYEAGQRVLEGIRIGLSSGETLGILGENGSGKSTLLRLMAGLLSPEEGEIILFGREMESRKRLDIARKISIVSQNLEPMFDFPVKEVVLMGRHPYVSLLAGAGSEDRDRAGEAMEKMGILDLRDKPVTRLSAGELQRVFIARSLAQDTPILLLDEPTASLDVRHQIELVELLAELREEHHRAIAIVSHDINLITHVATRVALLGGKTLLASGPVEEIVNPERLYETYGVRMIVEESQRGIVVGLPWDKFEKEDR